MKWDGNGRLGHVYRRLMFYVRTFQSSICHRKNASSHTLMVKFRLQNVGIATAREFPQGYKTVHLRKDSHRDWTRSRSA